ncbi:MAG: outer membrane protein assembly factor BamD [Actinomycetota bacterium]|nr:outer membrane protein assembly factor BamD [Actinomycetota bacterium]
MKKLCSVVVLAVFALALPACSKKQEVVPDFKNFNAEKSFDKANTEIDKAQYDKARQLLLQVKGQDRSGRFAPLAQLRIADSYYKQDDMDNAIDQYHQFLRMYPDHKYAPYAQYQIGMIYYSQIVGVERGYGAAQKALSEFETLESTYPRNPYKENVDIKIEKCKDIIAGYELLVGKFYFDKKAYRGAIGRFETVLKDFPGYRKEPQVLYLMAVSLNASGDKAKADEYDHELSAKYPDSQYVKKAAKALGSPISKK